MKKESGASGIALTASKYEVQDGFKLLLKVPGNTNYTTISGYKDVIQQILAEFFDKAPRLEIEPLASLTPTKVDIQRQTLEDIKKLDPNLARFIEITDSKLST